MNFEVFNHKCCLHYINALHLLATTRAIQIPRETDSYATGRELLNYLQFTLNECWYDMSMHLARYSDFSAIWFFFCSMWVFICFNMK